MIRIHKAQNHKGIICARFEIGDDSHEAWKGVNCPYCLAIKGKNLRMKKCLQRKEQREDDAFFHD